MARLTFIRPCRYCDQNFYADTSGLVTKRCSDHEQECPDRTVTTVRFDEVGDAYITITRAGDS